MTEIDRLIAGFRRFRDGYFLRNRELFQQLARHGQRPGTLIVSCCDSRVDPAVITDCSPGELFVIRNVANIVPPFEQAGAYHGTSAALQFGVCNLQVQHVVVLGHALCGGIRALLQQPEGSGGNFIDAWMSVAGAARELALAQLRHADLEAQARYCEQAAIRVSLANLLSFPWVQERVAAGNLSLHGWYFDLDAGELLVHDSVTGQFLPPS